MAETTQTTQTTQPKAPAAVTMPQSAAVAEHMQGFHRFYLTGRIFGGGSFMVWEPQQGQQGDPIWETRVRVAAEDPYEEPPQYCITSFKRLGRDGDDISIEVELVCRPWRPDKGERRWRYPHILRPVQDGRR